MRLWRRIWGWVSRRLAPGYSRCRRCGVSWRFTESHTTMYDNSNGILALCERCWWETDPEERLAAYKAVWIEWYERGYPAGIPWEVIRAAVLHEQAPLAVFDAQVARRIVEQDEGKWSGWYCSGDGGTIILMPALPQPVRDAWEEAIVGGLDVEGDLG